MTSSSARIPGLRNYFKKVISTQFLFVGFFLFFVASVIFGLSFFKVASARIDLKVQAEQLSFILNKEYELKSFAGDRLSAIGLCSPIKNTAPVVYEAGSLFGSQSNYNDQAEIILQAQLPTGTRLVFVSKPVGVVFEVELPSSDRIVDGCGRSIGLRFRGDGHFNAGQFIQEEPSSSSSMDPNDVEFKLGSITKFQSNGGIGFESFRSHTGIQLSSLSFMRETDDIQAGRPNEATILSGKLTYRDARLDEIELKRGDNIVIDGQVYLREMIIHPDKVEVSIAALARKLDLQIESLYGESALSPRYDTSIDLMPSLLSRIMEHPATSAFMSVAGLLFSGLFFSLFNSSRKK